ncbi:MAG TPA: myo-inosose-2 dehydratase [Bauldia sp.]|nr:myo-inosose-2 dehydratase [Bauldia sp.]
MAVRLGINPITWTNDDMPSLGGDTPIDQVLAETRAAGFSGTEMSFRFPKTSAELGPLLKRHGLVLVSAWYDGRILEKEIEAEWAAILPHMTLLRDLGCTHVVYADTSGRSEGDLFAPISRRPRLPDGEWSAYGRKLTALAEKMAAFGVRMAFHHHMGTIVETDGEVDRLMAATGPAVGLLYDSGHSLFAGGDPVALARRHVKRIVHVHCKDARPDVLAKARATDNSFMQAVLDGVFTMPGDGMVDYPTILKALHDGGYAGWIVAEAEQDPAKAHPLTYAKMGFANLARLCLAAGFSIDP